MKPLHKKILNLIYLFFVEILNLNFFFKLLKAEKAAFNFLYFIIYICIYILYFILYVKLVKQLYPKYLHLSYRKGSSSKYIICVPYQSKCFYFILGKDVIKPNYKHTTNSMNKISRSCE